MSFYYVIVGILYICLICVKYVFCKYVLPVCGLLFRFLKICFDEQKALFLMKSNFSVFYDVCFLCPQKPLPTPNPWKYFPLCSSTSFIIFDFTFMSIVHFTWTLMSRMRPGWDLSFPSRFQVVSAMTVEKSSIPNGDALASLFKIQSSFKCGSVSECFIQCHWSIS